MHLGRLDVCLRAEDVARSLAFYQSLGFEIDEGDPADSWVVVTNGAGRLGLFAPAFMSSSTSLNFRGANMNHIIEWAQQNEYAFEKPPTVKADGAGSASLLDPDGHLIFFDTASHELGANS